MTPFAELAAFCDVNTFTIWLISSYEQINSQLVDSLEMEQ